jgi:hypothetical protein
MRAVCKYILIFCLISSKEEAGIIHCIPANKAEKE